MPPNPVVAFGSSENSFYIGCGLRYYAPGMPNSLTSTVMNMPAIQIPWLVVDSQAQVWIARDAYHLKFHFDTGIPNDVLETLKGKAEYVTFGATKEQYFVKLDAGHWTANLQEGAMNGYQEIRTLVGPNFDAALTAIVFGKGNTMLYSFTGGFLYHLDDEAKGSELEKVLDDKMKDNEWLLERGSSLCQWSVNYFYFMFKHKPSGKVEIRWNLPESMNSKLLELREYADTPQGKQDIETREQNELMLANQRFQMSIATSHAMSSLWSNRW